MQELLDAFAAAAAAEEICRDRMRELRELLGKSNIPTVITQVRERDGYGWSEYHTSAWLFTARDDYHQFKFRIGDVTDDDNVFVYGPGANDTHLYQWDPTAKLVTEDRIYQW
jgi:hypothetical protein